MTADLRKNTMDNINLSNESLIIGINKTVKTIENCYGPAGSNVIIEEPLYPYFRVTNDGKLIVDKVLLANPNENIGANIIKEAGDKADKDSSDGRKTTMLILRSILEEALKSDEQPLKIKRALDAALPKVIEAIDLIKKPVEVEQIGSVASIASESPEIGELIQKIYSEIGKGGIIEIDNSNIPTSYYTLKDGVKFRGCSLLAPYMFNKGETAVYSKPHILVTRNKISTIADVDPLFQKLSTAGINEVVIFCNDIDVSVLDALAFTHKKGIFKTCIIKFPVLWKDWIVEDIAKVTGATIVESMNGLALKDCDIGHLGTCDKITVSREDTTILGIKDISEHIKDLETQSLENDQLKIRIAWLNTKAAILKMGASSESELAYIFKKAKDAIGASYLALKDGVIPGGGVTLLKVSQETDNEILKIALAAPFNQIVKNGTIPDENNEFAPDVLDSSLVVKNAVRNAISIAGTILTARTIITNPIKE